MHRIKPLGIGVLSAALLLAATAQADNRALLVGIGEYANETVFPNLPGIEIDISTIQQWAPRLGFTQVEILQNKEATYANVRAALQRLVSDLGDNDRALFYLSGHGAQFKDQNDDEQDKKDEALILYDSEVSLEEARNVLLDDEIGALIRQIKKGQLLMLIDVCHSGTIDKSVTKRGLAPLQASEYIPEKTAAAVKSVGYFDVPVRRVKSIEVVGRDPADAAPYVAINASEDNQSVTATSAGSVFTLGLNETLKNHKASSGITPQELRDGIKAFIEANVQPKENQFTPQLQGNRTLFTKPLSPASSSRANEHGELWAKLEEVLTQYGDSGMSLAADRGARIQIGQMYTLELQLPKDRGGYLSVIAVDSGSEEATVLFPNNWASNETRYDPGAEVKLPPSVKEKWGLKALDPASTTLIVALVTPEPLELYEKGIRKSRVDATLVKDEVFARLSAAGLLAIIKRSTRSTAAVAVPGADAKDQAAVAAKVIIKFHK